VAEAPSHPHNRAHRTFSDEQRPYPATAPRFSATPTAHAPMDIGDPVDVMVRWGVPQVLAKAASEGA
jgi:hypothetical protein